MMGQDMDPVKIQENWRVEERWCLGLFFKGRFGVPCNSKWDARSQCSGLFL